MALPKVSIIILNWNGWDLTNECLESLLRVKDIDFEVVIIDNGSCDDSISKIEKWAKSRNISESRIAQAIPQKLDIDKSGIKQSGMQRIILFSLSENIGFCAGNNLGLRQAQVNNIPYALILNNDTLVEPNFLAPLVKYADGHPEIGLVGGQIRYASDPQKIWHMGDKFNCYLEGKNIYFNKSVQNIPANPFFVDWISGCMTLMPLSVFSKIGGYDERLFLICDDWDLSLRVSKAGYKLTVVPSSIIYHKVSMSLGRRSPFVFYYSGRNLFLIWSEYFPKWKSLLLFAIYLPYKFIKAIFFTIKYNSPYCIYFGDMFFDAILHHYGKWRRHDLITVNTKRK